MESIGARIKKHRIANKMSQIDLAVALNVKPPSISQWESNNFNPSAEALVKMAEVFEVSAYYLVTGDERSSKNREADELANAMGESAIKALHLYRQLSPEMRETVLRIVGSLVDPQPTTKS